MYVEITRGRSFKGLAQYCLHDVGGTTDERVAFVQTRNLATDNPQLAWRIMAARHYLQDELKQKAGVGRGGAKDGKPVGHLLISWKREEAESQQLNHLGMINAANSALRAIGASDHQAIVIGHTDTEHPHCHVIINLIGQDGRLKKNWKEREKLSKFALKRELEIHGEAIVKTREKNWLDRKAGETPAPVKKKPRHLYDLDKAAQECPQTKVFAEQHRQKLAALERAKEALTQRHTRNRERLLWCHQERNRKAAEVAEQKIRAGKTAVRKAYSQSWRELLNEQEAGRRSFEKNEQNLKGSLANAMAMIDWRKLFGRKRDPNQLRLADAFQILTSEAVRREKLKNQHQAEQNALRAKQRQEERAKELAVREDAAAKLRDNRRAYLRKEAAMKRRQARNDQRLKERQQQLTRERNDLQKALQYREPQAKPDQAAALTKPDQANDNAPQQDLHQAWAKTQEAPAAETTGRIRRPRKERQPRQPRALREERTTKAIDVLPQDENAAQVAKQIDEFEERMAKRMQKREHARHKDRGGDRGR